MAHAQSWTNHVHYIQGIFQCANLNLGKDTTCHWTCRAAPLQDPIKAQCRCDDTTPGPGRRQRGLLAQPTLLLLPHQRPSALCPPPAGRGAVRACARRCVPPILAATPPQFRRRRGRRRMRWRLQLEGTEHRARGRLQGTREGASRPR